MCRSQRVRTRRFTDGIKQTGRAQRMWNRRVEYRGCGTDVSQRMRNNNINVHLSCAHQCLNRRVEYRGCETDVSSTEDVE